MIPSSSPQNVSLTPLSSTSFMITWSVSDPVCNYTVMWTNLNNSMTDSCTVSCNVDASEMCNCTEVQDNEISCNVTVSSDVANYDVSVSVGNMCGSKTSEPITVYRGEYLNIFT